MHVTTKEVDKDGTHILNSVIEGDGPFAVASDKAKLDAKVLSVERTSSGGVQVKVAVSVSEPAPEPAPEPAKPALSADEQAAVYLVSKGSSADEARASVERFGADKILAKRQKDLDSELDALLK